MAAEPSNKKKADMKVIILGDYSVGKTSLICRYIEGKFQTQEPTIGAAFFLKQWGPYNVAVWDTAGDEKYTGLSSFYCRNAGAAILAFDLNTSTSYESLWARFLPLLESAREDCLKVVVGTKSDLADSREITPEEAKQFSREINQNVNLDKLKSDPYFETSSKTGNNVTRVFEYIFDYCLPLTDDDKKYSQQKRDTVDLSHSSTGHKQGCCKS